jgi:DNA-directed RNA polymerase specialized sigma24 family protein
MAAKRTARTKPREAPKPANGEVRASTAARPARPEPIHALVERNYATLRRIASRKIRSSHMWRTITPTSLVAETVVRLMKQRSMPATDPHLCGLATVLMAQALSDRIKHRRARKRGGGARPSALDADLTVDRRRSDGRSKHGARLPLESAEIIAQMTELARTNPRMIEIVTLHVVLDLPMDRVAEILGISTRTGYRELERGRAALARRLGLDAP